MNRSAFIVLLAGALTVAAVQAEARPRIAFLTLSAPQEGAQLIDAFLGGMRRMGYAPDRDVDIDYRYAAGNVERLKQLAGELLASKPDLLVGSEPSPCRALKSVAPASPIVCLALTDALIPDLIASYPRPGGNVTGMAVSVEGLIGKLVEVAREIVPSAARIGLLSNPTGASMGLFAERVQSAARSTGLAVVTEQATASGDLRPAFDRFSKQLVQAVIAPPNGLFRAQRAEIARLALEARLPTIFTDRQYVAAGGLASYGVDDRENYRRGAGYAVRILKGAKPGDLPVEFPTKIELVINLRTAKTLGLDVPPSLVTRADEVIE
jgi:putative tryptophan/tyrosine transport system substrate-binding protein